MPDNIIIASGPSGATYNMATDYGFGATADAHVQIVKAVFGDTTSSTRVSNTNPMPVQLFSAYSGGSTASIIDNGELKVKGTLDIGNSLAIYGSTASFLKVIVAGGVTGTVGGTGSIGSAANPAVYSAVGITGSIQGISGGYAVTVKGTDLDIRSLAGGTLGFTGTDSGRDIVAVQGMSGGLAVPISGSSFDIRSLESSRDTVSVVGTIGSNLGVTGTVTTVATNLDIRDLAAGTDSVAVYNSSGGTTLPVDLYAAGTRLGVSGDALNVNFTNTSGITFSVNVASNIGVSNTAGTTMAVEGKVNMVPVRVDGAGAGDSVIVSASDLDIRNLTATDQVTVVGSVATNTANTATRVSNVDGKMATLNSAVSNITGKVDTANTSLTSLANSVTTVGTDKLLKTSVNQVVPPSTIFVETISVSGNGKPLRNRVLQNGITIKAALGNVGQVFVGTTSLQNASTNGYPLEPGEEIFISVSNSSQIYLRTTSSRSATVHAIGS
jgi:hypothetical protein